MNFPSKILEEAVAQFSKLPGIGHKTALRLVLHLLKKDNGTVQGFGEVLIRLKNEIIYCTECGNISSETTCNICKGLKRDRSIICIVEDIRDIIAIENTQQFNGLYHVLGGLISPMDGIGPSNLNIEKLLDRLNSSEVKEIVMALSANMEGDTTAFYISKKIKHLNINISTIARGISFGGELEFVDDLTLGRSILQRIPYEGGLKS